jgi:Thiamine biosynthesis ATP pyrophosphatase
MAKRGVEVIGVYFHSFPFTSDRTKEKVIDLAKIMSQYCGKIKLFVVPFTEIQTKIVEMCPGSADDHYYASLYDADC